MRFDMEALDTQVQAAMDEWFKTNGTESGIAKLVHNLLNKRLINLLDNLLGIEKSFGDRWSANSKGVLISELHDLARKTADAWLIKLTIPEGPTPEQEKVILQSYTDALTYRLSARAREIGEAKAANVVLQVLKKHGIDNIPDTRY